jgi:aspartate aminotransferase-like enzyme
VSASANPFIKPYLMTAGPTPLPPRVSQVMAEPVVYHRAPAGVALYARVLERLPAVFDTANDVMLFAATGSGAMESAVANLVRPGRPVLACAAGKFGERWIELAEAYGADVERYEPGWGARLDPDEVGRRLAARPEVEVCFATLSETSTGVVHDVRAIAEACRAHDVILAVDAVSGLAAAELHQDAWGIDVVVAGSQKALMCPPGIGLVSASPRALDHAAALPGPPASYYFNWARTVRAQRKDPPNSPFTPPVTLLAALDVALDLIFEEGLPQVHARHDLLARATRAGARALDLELFGDPDERSTVVTAIQIPDGVDGDRVVKLLRDRYGITANGGQEQLKGRILRIAHCGYFGAFDIVTSLAGLEMTLADLGADVELGAGVGAAQRTFLEAGVPVAGAT